MLLWLICHVYQAVSGGTDVQHQRGEARSYTSTLKLHVPQASYIHTVTDSEMMKLKNFKSNYFFVDKL